MDINKYKAILFDLDGTLLPLEQDEFVKQYFVELIKVMGSFQIEEKELMSAIWDGTSAMVVNDGSSYNEEVFWNVFIDKTKLEKEKVKPVLDAFYTNEFDNVKSCASNNKHARKVIELAHKNGRKVVLATNPLFPLDAQLTRLNWVGLKKEDFDLITSYESEKYCKPNPNYYREICERIHVAPEDCLMIGNDELEDMYAATSIGMDAYLVTDHEILRKECPWGKEKGSFESLLQLL